MRLPEICIERPVFATVLSLAILLIGLISYQRLPVREYPRIDEPVVSVNTTYRGASAEVVESQVTKILEDSLAGIEGVEVMTSQSRSETSRINVRFSLKRDPDSAAADVRDKVARVRAKMPDTIDEPVIAKVEADTQPIIYIAVEAGSLSAIEASDYVHRYIQPRLSVLPGASDVRIFGERQVSMRINIDRTRLAGYRLTVQDVEDAIRRQNAEIPAGRVESTTREFTVVAETDLSTPEQFNAIIVANVGGYPVRIRDIGNAEIGPVDERTVSRFNGHPSLNIGVIKQAVANPLELSNAVRAEVARMNETLPPGMKLVIAYDTSVFIDRSIHSVFETIGEAILLVVLVIFFFLRSLRATVIPIVTIPVALVGAFALMYFMGFTINTLTLLAMVLAIGLVVDDAIVMLENIFRHIEEGMPRRKAAILGSREIGFAIVAMTLTLTSVFAPLAFATGRTGRLFIEFALTLAGAVLVSGFVALTLSPMMCSLLLRHQEKHSRIYNLIEGWIVGLTSGYRSALTWTLHHRGLVVVLWFVVLGTGATVFMHLKSELAPTEDRGIVFGLVTAPQGSTPQYTGDMIRPIEDLYRDIPEAVAYTAIAGYPTVVDGSAVLRLKPWESRKRKQQEIAEELRPALAAIPGANVFVINPPSLGQSFRSTPIDYIVMSQVSYPELARVVDRMLDEVRSKYPFIQNLQIDLRLNTPEVRVNIKRDKLSDIGVPVDTLGRTLETYLGGRQVTRFKQAGEQYDVIVQAAAADRMVPADISGAFVRARDGGMVQLSNLVDIHEGVSPQSLNHFNRLRAVRITGTLAPGYSIDDGLKAMDAAAKATLPPTAQTDLDNQSREFRKSGAEIYFTFVLALAFIYLVLSAQFESFVHPFVIMLSVPLSMTGALIALYLAGQTLNIYSQVGLVTLVGLITKHGILIVEFSNQLRDKGESLMDAVVDAATLRLRPIIMTTGAMVLGAVPLATAFGAGAESRIPIGLVIVGGMLFGTLLTLFVVPTAYTLLARHRRSTTFDAAPHPATAGAHADD
ncbi:MAG TPA: efflux RND transporter permease subunit [Casimicrobiaceae bacterium]|jgi:multidrug efflux pump|nr:efflux RND transporter permease subunit [Casimicrobiaceae bacterium]